MNLTLFRVAITLAASIFMLVFTFYTLPFAIEGGDVVAAFAGGFVNPLASGYSTDAVSCWLILTAWIAYEAKAHEIRHGWICALLGVVPGVAVGFAVYLFMRQKQLSARADSAS